MEDREHSANGSAAPPSLPDFDFGHYDFNFSSSQPGGFIEPDVGPLRRGCVSETMRMLTPDAADSRTCEPPVSGRDDGWDPDRHWCAGATRPLCLKACRTSPRSLAAPITPTAPAVSSPPGPSVSG